MHPDVKEVNEIQSEIVTLEKRKKDVENEILAVKNRIKDIYLKYHNVLIQAGFYSNYMHFNSNKTLAEKFYISKYNLPYSDHGEGDYIRIKFKLSGLSLNLIYQCSYEPNNEQSLIRIPLNLLLDDNPDLKTFLDNHNSEALETHNKLIAETKQKKIDGLKKEIEALKNN